MSELRLIPEQASTYAFQTDLLIWVLTALSGVFTILVVGLVLYLSIKYRKGSSADRTLHGDAAHNALEITWTVIPTVLAIIFFVWSAYLFAFWAHPPKGALEISVVGKQWMWHIQHGNGRREVNQLHVPLGRPVKLIMTSQDVLHSFFIPAFRTKMDVVPGRYTMQWFEPSKVGEYRLYCAEYCGTEHSRMGGSVVVMPQEEYEKWLTSGNLTAKGTPETQGEKLFSKLGCATCHMSGVASRAPDLHGLFGSKVMLQSGEQVDVNEDYVQESILIPTAKLVSGYSPLMPTFKNQVSQTDITNLIAYIKSLK